MTLFNLVDASVLIFQKSPLLVNMVRRSLILQSIVFASGSKSSELILDRQSERVLFYYWQKVSQSVMFSDFRDSESIFQAYKHVVLLLALLPTRFDAHADVVGQMKV